MTRWATAFGLGALIASLAYRRKALTLDGAIAASIVGTITFARGGLAAAGALLAFFVSSSALSRVGERRKGALPLGQAKGAQRDAWQVLANGGVATLAIAAGHTAGMVGALAAAAADTWATELGMLAKRPPRLITTFASVPPGTSGGVTLQGLLASLGGALAVGVGCVAFGGRRDVVGSAVLGGLVGTLVDSLLGATLQAAYVCPRCDLPTETPRDPRCGGPTTLEHGLAWMTNDTVNALATLSGACAAIALRAKRGEARQGREG